MNETEPDMESVADTTAEGSQSVWPSPGLKLKTLRENMGLSHARVADALHMTAHYVKALENDQYEKLPGRTFVKGYFRAYARLLGADVDDIMQCYQKYVEVLEESEVSEANVIRARKAYDQNVRWLITAAVIIIVVVGVSWWFSGRHESEAAVSAGSDRNVASAEEARQTVQQTAIPATNNEAAKAMPVPEPAAPVQDIQGDDPEAAAGSASTAPVEQPGDKASATQEKLIAGTFPDRDVDSGSGAGIGSGAVTAVTEEGVVQSTLPDYTVIHIDDHRMVQLETRGDDTLAVHFSGASWIEIDNADNTRLYHDILQDGDDLSVRGKAPFNILIGDAHVVDLTFNSRQIEIARIRSDNSARLLLEP